MRRKLKQIIRKILFKNSRYYSQSYYRDRSFYMYNNIESLCSLFEINGIEVKTDNPIFLHTNIKFGSSLQTIKKKLGKPSCYIDKITECLPFKIMFYRTYIGGFKTKQEVHLYKNEMFHFAYVFSYLSDKNKEFLKSLLCKKYLKKECEIKDKIIIDKYNNKLFVTENIDFTINYLTGDPKFYEEFKTILKNTLKNRKELLEKNHADIYSKL